MRLTQRTLGMRSDVESDCNYMGGIAHTGSIDVECSVTLRITIQFPPQRPPHPVP